MAGCNAIVAGSAVFGAPSYADAVAAIKAAWDDETSQLSHADSRLFWDIFVFAHFFRPSREVGPEEDRPKIDPINNPKPKKSVVRRVETPENLETCRWKHSASLEYLQGAFSWSFYELQKLEKKLAAKCRMADQMLGCTFQDRL